MARFAYVRKFCIYAKFANVCKSGHVYTALYVQMRSGALLLVDNDLMRPVAIGCDFGLNVCPDHDKGNNDVATIGLDRHTHSQFDYRYLPPELFQGKNYNPRP